MLVPLRRCILVGFDYIWYSYVRYKQLDMQYSADTQQNVWWFIDLHDRHTLSESPDDGSELTLAQHYDNPEQSYFSTALSYLCPVGRPYLCSWTELRNLGLERALSVYKSPVYIATIATIRSRFAFKQGFEIVGCKKDVRSLSFLRK